MAQFELREDIPVYRTPAPSRAVFPKARAEEGFTAHQERPALAGPATWRRTAKVSPHFGAVPSRRSNQNVLASRSICWKPSSIGPQLVDDVTRQIAQSACAAEMHPNFHTAPTI